MADRTNYHVTHVNGHWQGKKEGAERASITAEKKDEAVAKTIELAKRNQPSSVRIHHLDGTIEDERTFKDDPFPPRG
jgi:hypothetical protein